MLCVVTGCAGFIGSSLSERLLNHGYTVRGVDAFLDYYPAHIKESNLARLLSHKKFSFIKGDLVSMDLTSVLSDVEVIFHQAGQAGVRASWGNYFATYTNHNILATQRLLESSLNLRSLKKFVNASSSSVYGDAESFPTKENGATRPVSPYGVTKLAAEHLVTLYGKQMGLNTVSLRYFTVYGPRQRPDMAFHRFIVRALRGESIEIFGDGEQSRDFTFIDDIVSANIKAAAYQDSGAVFNIGGGTQATVNQVLRIIETRTQKLKIEFSPKQLGEARHTSADTTMAVTNLGFKPAVSLEEGIAQHVAYLSQNLNLYPK